MTILSEFEKRLPERLRSSVPVASEPQPTYNTTSTACPTWARNEIAAHWT